MTTRIGVDVGGTFTDLIAYDTASGSVVTLKYPSSVEAPELAVVESVKAGLDRDTLAAAEFFLHGTTVGLNALLTRSGARVGLLATAGFRDVLEIRRGSREQMLNLWWRPPVPLVPRRLRFPVAERTMADGTIARALNEAEIAAAAELFAREGVEAVAIAFINAYANPDNECAAADALERAGFAGEISLSHQVSGEYREFERTSTTVVDAYVRTVTGGYFSRLADGLTELGCSATKLMMRSGGGAMTFDEAAGRPFETIISGPVAGVEGAASLSRTLKFPQVIAADVGGTSFDVSVILDGRPQILNQGDVVGFPIQAPWVDVRSIGAGGGSIAEIGSGGLLRVGPRSAGSQPGPACYGRGGTEPTVTDAALLLGMLGQGTLAGGFQLGREQSAAAIEPLAAALDISVEEAAAGVIRVVAAHMVDAIHEITVERGLDPRQGALMMFGGAGGLFSTQLATEAEISTVIVPPHCGNFSAWGLLGADIIRTAAQTLIVPLNDGSTAEVDTVLRGLFGRLEHRADISGEHPLDEAALDLRYQGQEYSLTIPVPFGECLEQAAAKIESRFAEDYERIFGHTLEEPVEIVTVRATLRTPLPGRAASATSRDQDGGEQPPLSAFSFRRGTQLPFAAVDRDRLSPAATVAGPALIHEETSITYLDVGFAATVHDTGSLIVTRQDGADD